MLRRCAWNPDAPALRLDPDDTERLLVCVTGNLIHRMSTPKMLRQARDLRGSYSAARLHDRLLTVLEQRLGHRLAGEIEQAK